MPLSHFSVFYICPALKSPSPGFFFLKSILEDFDSCWCQSAFMRDKSSGKKFKPILFKVNLPPKVGGEIKYFSTFSVFYISKKNNA